MDRQALVFTDGSLFINGVAQHIHDATEGCLADRYADRLFGV